MKCKFDFLVLQDQGYVFFSSGLTIACLHCSGKTSVNRELLIIDVNSGNNSSKHSFSSHVGMGSSLQDLLLYDTISALSSSIVAGRMFSNFLPLKDSSTVSSFRLKLLRILLI